MSTEDSNNEVLSDFKVRQSSGAFVCHYRNCPRAVQGFSTSELRHSHEESHRPRFQCAHPPCGYFGTTFSTRSAMKSHDTRYHEQENTASVPNILNRKPRNSGADKTLFSFTERNPNRRAEGSSPRQSLSGQEHILSPRRSVSSDLLQPTATGHKDTRLSESLLDSSQQPSPFDLGSALTPNPVGSNSNGLAGATVLDSTARLELQQDSEEVAHNWNPPQLIPREPHPDFHYTEENDQWPRLSPVHEPVYSSRYNKYVNPSMQRQQET